MIHARKHPCVSGQSKGTQGDLRKHRAGGKQLGQDDNHEDFFECEMGESENPYTDEGEKRRKESVRSGKIRRPKDEE